MGVQRGMVYASGTEGPVPATVRMGVSVISLSEKILSIRSAAAWNDLAERQELCRLPGVFPEIPGILSWGWIDRLLHRSGGHPERFRFFLRGKAVDPCRFGLIDRQGQLDRTALQPLLPQGLTIVFNRLDSSSDSLWEEAGRLEQALGAVISIDAIGSFGMQQGLPLHYDNRDLILVQVAGRKRWTVLGAPVDGPWRKRPVPRPETVVDDFVMEPGDTLFVPAGLHHYCVPLEPSLHLGILIRRPCGADLLKSMQQSWEVDPALGNRLDVPEAGTVSDRQQAAMKQALIRLVDGADIAALTRDWLARKQRPPGSGLAGSGPFSAVTATAQGTEK